VPYYRDVIRAAAFSEEMKSFRMEQFDGFIRDYSLSGNKIIEIGCGRGEYLSIIGELGVEPYGLENLEESVMQCVKNGLSVQKGFIENGLYKLDHAPFDAFFILNFLEHLPDPNSTLRGMYNNLSDGGLGLVEVPNFDMILRKNLFSEFTCDHLCYFTTQTLETTLDVNGFDVIECKEIWYDYIISAIVRKRSKLDISRFYKHQFKLYKELNEYITSFEPQKVAIWGAGHQALAIMSLAKLTDKIRYVVDSATFKQGKYTPATHIPIVAPDKLDADPIDAIIIMAAGYSDEVAGILKQRSGPKINIGILRDFGIETID
jgi:SAM-dependent methyltransferase